MVLRIASLSDWETRDRVSVRPPTREECGTWVSAALPEALKLQRPLPDGSLKIVATAHDRMTRGSSPVRRRAFSPDSRLDVQVLLRR
jgi:hypothetical protein